VKATRQRRVDGNEPVEWGKEKANGRIRNAIRELLETPLQMRASLRGPGHENGLLCTYGRGRTGDGLTWRIDD
jgi:hypothetical protein